MESATETAKEKMESATEAAKEKVSDSASGQEAEERAEGKAGADLAPE